jgi:putative ABC transport system permease protein
MLMNFLNELRYTLRILGKNFRFTLLCVSVIFMGVAIVLPVYALIDNLALKTPRLSPGDEYVVLNKQLATGGRGVRYDAFHLQTFRDKAASFKALHAWRDLTATISDGEYAEGFSGVEIEPELLQRLQVQPVKGRLLMSADDAGAEAPVVLISYDVWQTYYAGREDIVGHQSRINGQLRSIIGVMPEGFGFPVRHRVWLPLAPAAGANPGEGPENLAIVGILARGVSSAEATTEISLLQTVILADWPEPYAHIRDSSVLPYVYFNVDGGSTNTFALLTVLATIVLLVACNASNLFVARGEERIQELAVRSALGATPARVARSLLLESLLVCCAGLLAGWVWAYFGMAYLERALINLGAGVLTDFFWSDMSLSGRMLAGSALTTVVVWLGSGGLPAWRISRTNLNELMQSGNKGLGEQGATRLSKLLVNVQLVLGCVLLTVGITSFTLSFNEQITTQANSDNLYTGRFSINANLQADAQARQTWLDTLRQSLLNQPGVEDVVFTSALPGNGPAPVPYGIEDQDLRVNAAWPRAFSVFVTDKYFDLIDVDLVQGRSFGAGDSSSGLPVAIVDQRLADRLWPEESALGKRLQLNPDDDSPWLTIIGVAAPSVMEGSLREGEPGLPVIYQAMQQAGFSGRISAQVSGRMALLVRATTGFDYRNAIRNAAAAADRDTPVSNIQSLRAMEQARADGQALSRNAVYAVLLIAIYLTGAATYGLAARAAGRRRRETGIRMALGASSAACVRMFLKDGCRMLVYGLGIGGALAIAISYSMFSDTGGATEAIRSLIPSTLFLGVLMGVLVLLANYFPARKIVAMDPADALRYE